MGYVFDALLRAGGQPDPNDPKHGKQARDPQNQPGQPQTQQQPSHAQAHHEIEQDMSAPASLPISQATPTTPAPPAQIPHATHVDTTPPPAQPIHTAPPAMSHTAPHSAPPPAHSAHPAPSAHAAPPAPSASIDDNEYITEEPVAQYNQSRPRGRSMPTAQDNDIAPSIPFNPNAVNANADEVVDIIPENEVIVPLAFNPTPEQIEGVDERLVALTSPASIMAEEYRSIRTTMLARIKHRRNVVHMITSATPQEGKTFTSLNLGMSLAELRNRKTIVIEADLRLPQFQSVLNLPDNKGLVHLLQGDASLSDVVMEVGERKLHVIQAGTRVSDQAVELLSRGTMKNLLKTLRRRYDHIIIDTPPVVELADAGIIGGISDEVLLIVRMNRTPRELAIQAMRTLESYNAPVAGVIATDKAPQRRRYYAYRYGYRYTYQHYSKAA